MSPNGFVPHNESPESRRSYLTHYLAEVGSTGKKTACHRRSSNQSLQTRRRGPPHQVVTPDKVSTPDRGKMIARRWELQAAVNKIATEPLFKLLQTTYDFSCKIAQQFALHLL